MLYMLQNVLEARQSRVYLHFLESDMVVASHETIEICIRLQGIYLVRRMPD